jgi:hypothetical protein
VQGHLGEVAGLVLVVLVLVLGSVAGKELIDAVALLEEAALEMLALGLGHDDA